MANRSDSSGLTFAPTPRRETERKRPASPAAQCALRPESAGLAPARLKTCSAAAARGAARPAPRDSARLRAPGFRGHQHRAGEPGQEGNLGDLCPRSPESVLPLRSTFPRRLAQGSTFPASGPARLALGERSRLQRHHSRPSPSSSFRLPQTREAEFLLVFA